MSRDWYAEWLLGEVVEAARRGPRPFDVTAHWDGSVTLSRRGETAHFVDPRGLEKAYRDLTGHEPPPQPTEEEVRAWEDGLHSWMNAGTFRARLLDAAASEDPRERLMARAVVEAAQ